MKRYLISAILISISILIPGSVFAAVSISEIAWMGTDISPNDEWLELYNDGDSSVSLDGWTLIATDGAPSITLSGSVGGNGYFLLERTDDTTVPDVTADQIFTGAFGNEGETLLLKDGDGTTIDTISAAGGWPAGDSVTHETMQLSGSSWIKASGTPRAENVSGGNDDENDSGGDDAGGDDQDDDTDSGNSSSAEAVIQVDPDPVYVATLIAPDFAVRGVAAHFESMVTKDSVSHTIRGRYKWSMGDGTWYAFEKSTPIDHIYEYAGTYTVVFQYYSNDLKEKPDSIHKKVITVVADTVAITAIDGKGGVTLSNTTGREVDLGGWKLVQGQNMYTIPEYTYLKSKSTFIVPSRVTHFEPQVPTLLQNPNGDTISFINMPHTSLGEKATQGTVKSRVGTRSFVTESLPIVAGEQVVTPLDQAFRETQAASVLGSSISFPVLGTPFLLFLILVLVTVLGYSVYIYGFPKRTKSHTETPTTAEYDLDDILRGS